MFIHSSISIVIGSYSKGLIRLFFFKKIVYFLFKWLKGAYILNSYFVKILKRNILKIILTKKILMSNMYYFFYIFFWKGRKKCIEWLKGDKGELSFWIYESKNSWEIRQKREAVGFWDFFFLLNRNVEISIRRKKREGEYLF